MPTLRAVYCEIGPLGLMINCEGRSSGMALSTRRRPKGAETDDNGVVLCVCDCVDWVVRIIGVDILFIL